MGIEIRHATPDDASDIRRLAVNHLGRLYGTRHHEPVPSVASTDQLRHHIGRSASKMQWLVAASERGEMLAMLQTGVWGADRENEFTASRWQQFRNGLREWPGYQAIYGLMVSSDLKYYRHQVVNDLLDESGIFSGEHDGSLRVPIAVAANGTEIDHSYRQLLTTRGLRATDRTGQTTAPGLLETPYHAKLMTKKR